MPIHEYKCSGCGRTFEHLKLSNNDEDPFKCQMCGSNSIERVFPGKQVVKYKGTGFHKTDYPTVKHGKNG